MKLKSFFTTITKKLRNPRLMDIDHKQEALIKQGREQFKKMMDKGLGVPVVFL